MYVFDRLWWVLEMMSLVMRKTVSCGEKHLCTVAFFEPTFAVVLRVQINSQRLPTTYICSRLSLVSYSRCDARPSGIVHICIHTNKSTNTNVHELEHVV